MISETEKQKVNKKIAFCIVASVVLCIGITPVFAANPILSSIGSIVTTVFGWLLEIIFTFVVGIMETICGLFLSTMNIDLTAIESSTLLNGFNFFHEGIKIVAVALATIMVGWQIFSIIVSPAIGSKQTQSVGSIFVRALIFIPLTYVIKDLAFDTLRMFQNIYSGFFSAYNAVSHSGLLAYSFLSSEIPAENFVDGLGINVVFTEGGAATALAGVISLVIGSIFIIGITLQFLKLLLEMMQRFVVMLVYVYLSPLAFACGVGANTIYITKQFLTVFISSGILWILNVWSVGISLSLFSYAGEAFSAGTEEFFLWAILTYGFLKIAQRLDDIFNMVGASNAKFTGSLLEDLLTAQSLQRAFSPIHDGIRSATGQFAEKGFFGTKGNNAANPVTPSVQKIAKPDAQNVAKAGQTAAKVAKPTGATASAVNTATNVAKAGAAATAASMPAASAQKPAGTGQPVTNTGTIPSTVKAGQTPGQSAVKGDQPVSAQNAGTKPIATSDNVVKGPDNSTAKVKDTGIDSAVAPSQTPVTPPKPPKFITNEDGSTPRTAGSQFTDKAHMVADSVKTALGHTMAGELVRGTVKSVQNIKDNLSEQDANRFNADMEKMHSALSKDTVQGRADAMKTLTAENPGILNSDAAKQYVGDALNLGDNQKVESLSIDDKGNLNATVSTEGQGIETLNGINKLDFDKVYNGMPEVKEASKLYSAKDVIDGGDSSASISYPSKLAEDGEYASAHIEKLKPGLDADNKLVGNFRMTTESGNEIPIQSADKNMTAEEVGKIITGNASPELISRFEGTERHQNKTDELQASIGYYDTAEKGSVRVGTPEMNSPDTSVVIRNAPVNDLDADTLTLKRVSAGYDGANDTWEASYKSGEEVTSSQFSVPSGTSAQQVVKDVFNSEEEHFTQMRQSLDLDKSSPTAAVQFTPSQEPVYSASPSETWDESPNSTIHFGNGVTAVRTEQNVEYRVDENTTTSADKWTSYKDGEVIDTFYARHDSGAQEVAGDVMGGAVQSGHTRTREAAGLNIDEPNNNVRITPNSRDADIRELTDAINRLKDMAQREEIKEPVIPNTADFAKSKKKNFNSKENPVKPEE